MADIADIAEKSQQQILEASILNRVIVEPLEIGVCLNCEANLKEGSYCDDDCQADHTRRKQFIESNFRR